MVQVKTDGDPTLVIDRYVIHTPMTRLHLCVHNMLSRNQREYDLTMVALVNWSVVQVIDEKNGLSPGLD